jgi:MSHA pilin protein MshC
MHMPAQHPRQQRGFTLVELVTVIAIIGVLSAVAVPRFFADRPFAERGYADELASALRTAQKVAVASGCWVSISVTPAGYEARQGPNPTNCSNPDDWPTPVQRADGTVLAGQTAAGVTVAGTSEFIFDGAGTLAAAASNVQVGPYTVTVVPATGLVTVN